ncbi:MAG: hypothetical protein J6331_01495, partial [Lentisphaeria bacterium]|nr:hypothetical protein [Lentisphaeria bacterium]
IGVLNEKDEFVLLGYLTRHGFSKEKPRPEDWIWAEEESPWIPLREIFPQGGVQRIVIRSFGVLICGKGEYFHSLHTLILSPEKNKECKEAYRLIFLNEVEPERENFHFSVNLTTKA